MCNMPKAAPKACNACNMPQTAPKALLDEELILKQLLNTYVIKNNKLNEMNDNTKNNNNVGKCAL